MTEPFRLSSDDFVILGRAGMDFYADPPGTTVEEAHSFTACLGGSSANIAAALVRQGARATLVTRVADDATGRFVLAELDRYGIDRRHVRTSAGEARTSLAVVETRPAPASVIYRNNAADFMMDESDIVDLDLPGRGALVCTGTALAAEPSRGACFLAFERARAAGVPIVLDLDYRPYSWPSPAEAAETCGRAAALASLIVGNDEEFGLLAGDHAAGLACARALVDGGAAMAVYKMGPAGAVTIMPGREFRTPPFPVDALKPTGAGDAFAGGLLAGLSRGLPPEEAVRRGAAAAALVVTRVGCAPAMPAAAELDAFLARFAD